jgi:hypothetical protein
MAWKLQLLLFLAVMTDTGAEGRYNYSSQLTHAVTSLNRLLDYMLEPRSVIGDMIFGVVLARGMYQDVKMEFLSWSGVRLSPLGTSATIWPMYLPRMMDDDECGVVGAMIGRGNQSNRKNLPQWRIINQKSHMT